VYNRILVFYPIVPYFEEVPMSVESVRYIAEGTCVTFELCGTLPIFRETYHSPQAGTVVLKGLFNQSAHIELEGGARFRTLSPRKAPAYPTELSYPVVCMPDKRAICTLRTPLKLDKGSVPKLRFVTSLDDQPYVFRQITAGQRGFELWDGLEVNKLVERDTSPAKLIRDSNVLIPVPALLIMLLPWLDNQTIMYRQP
jgi:hypothetical protein